jgi:E3 Ubiquitin ligase
VLYVRLVAGVALLGGAVVAMERLTRQPEGVKRIQGAPLTPVAEVTDATDVRIEGTVEVLAGTKPAPVSGVACVFYEHVARAGGGQVGGLPSIATRVLHRAESGVPFVVRDATGYAIIDPDGATALLQVHHRAKPGESRSVVDLIDPTSSSRTGLTHIECVIRPGDRLVVIGRAVREPDPDPTTAGGTYRDGPATRLRFMSSPQFPLHLLDPARKA